MLNCTPLLTRRLRHGTLSSFAARKMSTFTLPGSNVAVKLVEELSKEQLLEFPAFKVRIVIHSSVSHAFQLRESRPNSNSKVELGCKIATKS
jgi:hypothetical protein